MHWEKRKGQFEENYYYGLARDRKSKKCVCQVSYLLYSVYFNQCCGDPELLPESGSGTIVPDPDPANNERADK